MTGYMQRLPHMEGGIVFDQTKAVLSKIMDDEVKWVYITHKGEKTVHNKHDVFPWIQRMPDCLELVRFDDEPNDTDWKGLRPRVEIVYRYLIPKDRTLRIQTCFIVSGDPQFRGIIFQCMDHTIKNGDVKALPIFQLEVRDQKLHTRWSEVENSQYKGTKIKAIRTLDLASGYPANKVDVFLNFSANKKRGHMRVYLQDRFVWERKGVVTASTYGKPLQIQQGIYGVADTLGELRVYGLQWAFVDAIPTSATLGSNTTIKIS